MEDLRENIALMIAHDLNPLGQRQGHWISDIFYQIADEENKEDYYIDIEGDLSDSKIIFADATFDLEGEIIGFSSDPITLNCPLPVVYVAILLDKTVKNIEDLDLLLENWKKKYRADECARRMWGHCIMRHFLGIAYPFNFYPALLLKSALPFSREDLLKE